MFPEIIANEVASLLALGGIVGFAAGRPGLAAGMLLSSLACRMISRDPLPREEYADVLEKIGETRLKFLDKFKDPLRTAPNSADALAGHHALRYARLSISALTEKLSTNSAEHRTMMLKLRQALLLLDLSVDPCDYLAPAAIKSLHFEDDLKTLDLLSRMFDTAGDFSLNCFEHDRARFEEDFKRLKAHLDTVQLNHVVQAVAAEPELSPIAPQS
jgi:hypothetical protein